MPASQSSVIARQNERTAGARPGRGDGSSQDASRPGAGPVIPAAPYAKSAACACVAANCMAAPALCQHRRRTMQETAAMNAPNPSGSRMLPTDRIAYSAIAERPPLKLPGGARMAIWVIVNVEEWDPKDTMPRTVLTPPAGGAPTPDIPNWCWHEYGNRVGFWRMLKVFDEFADSRRAGDQRLRHRGVPADRQGGAGPQVGVHRPRLHPAQHAEGAGREGRHPHDHRGDQEGDRQAAARLARAGPDRDLGDAGPA